MHLTGTFTRRRGSIHLWWLSTICPGTSWSHQSASVRCCWPCSPLPGTACSREGPTGVIPGLQGGGELCRSSGIDVFICQHLLCFLAAFHSKYSPQKAGFERNGISFCALRSRAGKGF